MSSIADFHLTLALVRRSTIASTTNVAVMSLGRAHEMLATRSGQFSTIRTFGLALRYLCSIWASVHVFPAKLGLIILSIGFPTDFSEFVRLDFPGWVVLLVVCTAKSCFGRVRATSVETQCNSLGFPTRLICSWCPSLALGSRAGRACSSCRTRCAKCAIGQTLAGFMGLHHARVARDHPLTQMWIRHLRLLNPRTMITSQS